MAQRGTPIPYSDREQIKKLLQAGKSHREIARILRLARETVRKYGARRSTLKNLYTSLGRSSAV